MLEFKKEKGAMLHLPLITESHHTLVPRTRHDLLLWLHVDHSLTLWGRRTAQSQSN